MAELNHFSIHGFKNKSIISVTFKIACADLMSWCLVVLLLRDELAMDSFMDLFCYDAVISLIDGLVLNRNIDLNK